MLFRSDLDVEAGDFIAVYVPTGNLVYKLTGGGKCWKKGGNGFGDDVTFAEDGETSTPSLYGTGTGTPAALDYVKFDVVPSEIALDTLGSPTDITTLNASTTAHGLLPKLPNDATQFLDGTGAWATLASGDIPDISATYAVVAQTMYIGTTQVAINRGSAALTLAGITLTTPNIGAATMGGNLTGGDYHITGLGRVNFTQELDNGSKTTDFTVDFATDQKQKCTLTANTITLTLDTTSVGVGNYLLKIVNGGLATLTWASESGSIYFPGGTDPDLTSSGTDIVSFYFDGTNWYGVSSLDFS